MEALKIAEREELDLAISDYRMPYCTGGEFIQKLRQIPINSSIPVIIYSGYIKEAKEKTIHKENVKFIEKPVPMDELVMEIKLLMDEGLSYLKKAV